MPASPRQSVSQYRVKVIPLGRCPWKRHCQIVSIRNFIGLHLRENMMGDGYLHQQARLTTGTIAYNDQLSTDLRHVDGGR
jgi:hypothetical protein